MKSLTPITLPVFLALSFTLVQAQDELTQESVDATCAALAESAELLMESRQIGTPMANMMRIQPENPIWREMVEEAYRVNRYTTESVKWRVIEDFRDAQHLKCLDLLRPPSE